VLHGQGELEGHEGILRLARLKMLYHDADDALQAENDLAVALQLLETEAQHTGAPANVAACETVARSAHGVAKRRAELTRDLAQGVSPKELAQKLVQKPSFTSVDRRSNLSLAEYFEEYLDHGRPVIITDYEDRVLSGHSSWGWDEVVDACGEMEVMLSQRYKEARHLWAGLGHAGNPRSLRTWIADIRNGQAGTDAYLMDWGLVGRCSKFLASFNVPKYFVGDLWKRMPFNSSDSRDFFGRHPSLFAGAAGSGGALHVDSYASTFWQFLLRGRKRWTLYALPDELRRTLLYAGVEHEIMPHVPVPGETRTNGTLPLLDVAEEFKVVAEVGPGELMIVPFDVPHMVENIEDVLALSMNVLEDKAVPRLREELNARSCFSGDEALPANLQLLQGEVPPRDVDAIDTPFDSYRSYGPRPVAATGLA